VARALRDDPRWIGSARVWPFETGLRAPANGSVVIAEVYPSLWAVSPEAGETKDAAQVRSVARFFAERDRTGELGALFAGDPGLTQEQRNRVETEEAWTLGVTRGENSAQLPCRASLRPLPTRPSPAVRSAAPTFAIRPRSRAARLR